MSNSDNNSSSSATASDTTATQPRKPRGFAAMDPEKVRAIAAKGGVAAHAKGSAHQFSKDEAKAAGRKGGVAFHKVRGRGPGKVPTSTAAAPASEE